jgi:hypothetical protein
VVRDTQVHRGEGEIVGAAGVTFEWDFLAPVRVMRAEPRRARKADDFIIYFDRDRYIRPPPPPLPRVLTPTELGSGGVTECDFVAIFEVTTKAGWAQLGRDGTGGLLPRLEARLRLSVERARSVSSGGGDGGDGGSSVGGDAAAEVSVSASAALATSAGGATAAAAAAAVRGVVAVIGVVSPFSCQRSISKNLTAERFPLLHAMMAAHRFVFMRLACHDEEYEEEHSGASTTSRPGDTDV